MFPSSLSSCLWLHPSIILAFSIARGSCLLLQVTAPLFLTQQLLPRLRQCGGEGRVLNIGSGIADRVQVPFRSLSPPAFCGISSQLPRDYQAGTGTYGVSKKALHRLTLQMAAELSADVHAPAAGNAGDNRVWVAYARPGWCLGLSVLRVHDWGLGAQDLRSRVLLHLQGGYTRRGQA